MRRRLSLTVLLSALALTIGVARITAVSPIADAAMVTGNVDSFPWITMAAVCQPKEGLWPFSSSVHT